MELYPKIKVLARGSHGLVALCRKQDDGKFVVVKEVVIDHLSEKDKEITMNEVHVISNLSHPNIIAYYDSFIQEASVCIVMEYANKGSLHDHLIAQDGKLLQQQEVIDMLTQIVLGLNYIHSQKVLHRDLKTHNILISHDSQAFSLPILKIGDFGISKALTSQSKASTLLGTPAYLSPEICMGQPYDKRSDMWALGCVLYEMLTLRKAFDSSTLASLVVQIMQGYVTPINTTVYGPAMQQLVNDLLQTSASDRPTTEVLLAHPLLIAAVCKVSTGLGRITPYPK